MHERDRFLNDIRKKALTRSSDGVRIVRTTPSGNLSIDEEWIIDFRAIMLQPHNLNTYAEIFWETYGDSLPFQVCGLETAGIPLVTAVVMKSVERGTPVNGLFIRKSRKREGLMRAIEGTLTDEPVIIVDDLMNTGGSLFRQIDVLADAGARVRDSFAILAFRGPDAYAALEDKGVAVRSLFTLKDIGLGLLSSNTAEVPKQTFDIIWKRKFPGAALEHVLPKSSPVLDENTVYIGSDEGVFYALDAHNGDIRWQFPIGKHPNGKGIFSTPAIHEGIVYFGGYDGTFYALRSHDGALLWKNEDADWIGSSPSISKRHGLVYIGLEYGLWKKHGGIAALDLKTGRSVWKDRTAELTHGSPLAIDDDNLVVIGSNDGAVYGYEAASGDRRWVVQSRGEVKASFAYDKKRHTVMFGSFDGTLHGVSAADGSPMFAVQTGARIYSTPLVVNDRAYIASMDKYVYAVDLTTGTECGSYGTNGRIFASPILFQNSIWIGSNDGRLYELDPVKMKLISYFQASERIVGRAAGDAASGRIYAISIANELYCLQKKR